MGLRPGNRLVVQAVGARVWRWPSRCRAARLWPIRREGARGSWALACRHRPSRRGEDALGRRRVPRVVSGRPGGVWRARAAGGLCRGGACGTGSCRGGRVARWQVCEIAAGPVEGKPPVAPTNLRFRGWGRVGRAVGLRHTCRPGWAGDACCASQYAMRSRRGEAQRGGRASRGQALPGAVPVEPDYAEEGARCGSRFAKSGQD